MSAFFVHVQGITAKIITVKVADDMESFRKTTVEQLKQKIYEANQYVEPEFMRLSFVGKELEAEKTLEYYNFQVKSFVAVVIRVPGGSKASATLKVYPDKFPLEFTNEPDCIDPVTYSDDTSKRVKMKCGHAVNPNSLTEYCRNLIDENKFKFVCPAVDNWSSGKCEKEWDYADIRLAALLTDAEKKYFETKISDNAVLQYSDGKECPGCGSWVERRDKLNLRVHCPICTKEKSRTYDFCWHCLNEWSGPTTSSEKCGNSNCVNPDIAAIMNTSDVLIAEKMVPNRRACPTCGKVVEHTTDGCKYVACPRCNNKFCFLCLKLKEKCQESAPQSWFGHCASDVAPKQTVIPKWNEST